MSSIQTGIELNDQFSGVLNNIISSVNLAVSAMYDMQQSMNTDIDTSSLEGARDEINQATAAIEAMNQAASRQTAPDIAPPVVDGGNGQVINMDVNPVLPDPLVENPEPIRPEIQPNAPPDPEPVEIPVTWNTDGVDVFTGTGDVYITQDSSNINKWGILQYFDTLQKGENGQAKADALLKLYNKKTRNLKITNALGDNRVRAGSMVVINLDLGDVKLKNWMLVEKCKHTYKEGEHWMDLTLRGGEFVA